MARIGVYVCWCGTNIAKMVDVEAVAREIAGIRDVIVSKDYKYMCSDPGQDLLIKDIKEHGLNRIVVASCSPRMHEITFRKALIKSGLNPYLLEMANIREHVSWVHEDRTEATKKAKALIVAAIARVRYHKPLDERTVEVNPDTLIIGGGITGMKAALEIADAGKKVFLIEKNSNLGGNAAELDLTFPYMYSAAQMLKPILQRVCNNDNIDVFLNSQVKEITGYVGNFHCIISGKDGKDVNVEFGNVIIATGLKHFNPLEIPEYGYGKLPNVITSAEFEKMLINGKITTSEGKTPENIAIIHCVGSRNKNYHEYCSRVCCMTALKFSNQIRSELPETNIFQMYADMRTFGKGCEELYAYTSKRNVKFLMFNQQKNLPVVSLANSKLKSSLQIEIKELLSGKTFIVPADMVVLMVAMEARETAKETGHLAGISMCSNSFYIEKHPKLDPVATTTNGVYIAGCCQSPKDIPDSVSQASAAAARIVGTICKGSVNVEATTAHIDDSLCRGCKMCIPVCPYSAIIYDDKKSIAAINPILCKGCGTCVALCRSKSIDIHGYTNKQIYAQVVSLLNEL